MSGDVQPRKRKDKKRKKDELGVEEPRGTAAALGEGDVFMHSQHEHGTGGHWCAKIIFFSLLAVLITLIGLIILENRGLTELEANSVESRYSGVLEGWLEDAPDDDHHDEHTLELKHHEDEDDHEDHSPEIDPNDDDNDQDEDDADHDDDDVDHQEDVDHDEDEDDQENDDKSQENDDDDHESAKDSQENYDESQENDDDDHENDNDDEVDNQNEDEEADSYYSEEHNLEQENEQDDDEHEQKYEESEEDDNDDDDDDNDNDLRTEDGDDDSVEDNNDGDDETHRRSLENDDDDDDNTNENNNDSREDEEDDEHEEEEEVEDNEIEVEKLEKEVTDDDVQSEEQASDDKDDDDDDDDKNEDKEDEATPEDDDDDDDNASEDEEFLEADDIEEDLPVVEHIVAPKGKPLNEIEEESTVKPVDTLAEEEEYEKQQDELRREQEQASHMWLKLVVGGALLVATHAVVRRAIAPRDDDTQASEEHASREETPSLVDRRMTLIPPELSDPATREFIEEIIPKIEEKVKEKFSSVTKAPPTKEESEEELEDEEEEEVVVPTKAPEPFKNEPEDKELYSDEDEPVEEEEIEDEEVAQKVPSKPSPIEKEVTQDDDEVPDDVEIIDDEQIEEELQEEEYEDEEEISDVDDAELLSRLEAKYGRLPEPERPGPKHKDGGNSIEDDWPGEPADKYWRQQLDQAEEELRQGSWSTASERLNAAALQKSARAKWLAASAIDREAEVRRDNRLLTRAINAYLEVLKMNERLSDVKLLQVTDRILDRIRFRGNYLSAEPVYRLLIRRFPDVAAYRNNLTVSYLMANRADLAEVTIKETLKKWPDDRFALAHLGFVLKTQHNKLEEAVDAFQKALKGDIGPATEPRFYYHLGDALLLLGRFEEAHEVHKRGAVLGHFLSPSQRSLYNVERLKSQPWWNIENTPYMKLARALEKSWKEILKEGEAARAIYEKEKEGLKERGEWSQLDLFVRGQEIPDRCKRAPVTCSIVRTEVAAVGCRRGQIKFSSMEAGTHVRPHVGPTNCRLRMHLGLSNTKDTYIRVDKEIRQWQVGKVLMFDDSFEHEVWHNGTGSRLVLIVDVWHPSLTAHERRTLPAI